MRLSVQIYSFISSFLFGCGFYYLLDVFNRLMSKFNLVLKIIFSFVFIISMACIYFLILLFVNNGVVHVYFFLSILVGYIFDYKVTFCLFTQLRKK